MARATAQARGNLLAVAFSPTVTRLIKKPTVRRSSENAGEMIVTSHAFVHMAAGRRETAPAGTPPTSAGTGSGRPRQAPRRPLREGSTSSVSCK